MKILAKNGGGELLMVKLTQTEGAIKPYIT